MSWVSICSLMLPVHGRTFLRVLVAVGLSELAAEAVFIGFNTVNPSRENGILERMQGETAAAALTYGAIFVLAVLARKFPAWAFPPPTPHQTQGKRIGPRIIVPMALALFVFATLVQVVGLAMGVLTPRDAMVNLLHAYPIAGLLGASGIAARGPSVASAAPGAG
jgi:hypothetical protein